MVCHYRPPEKFVFASFAKRRSLPKRLTTEVVITVHHQRYHCHPAPKGDVITIPPTGSATPLQRQGGSPSRKSSPSPPLVVVPAPPLKEVIAIPTVGGRSFAIPPSSSSMPAPPSGCHLPASPPKFVVASPPPRARRCQPAKESVVTNPTIDEVFVGRAN